MLWPTPVIGFFEQKKNPARCPGRANRELPTQRKPCVGGSLLIGEREAPVYPPWWGLPFGTFFGLSSLGYWIETAPQAPTLSPWIGQQSNYRPLPRPKQGSPVEYPLPGASAFFSVPRMVAVLVVVPGRRPWSGVSRPWRDAWSSCLCWRMAVARSRHILQRVPRRSLDHLRPRFD